MQINHKNKVLNYGYVAISAFIAIALTFLLSNLFWLQSWIIPIPPFAHSEIIPYEQTVGQQRFSVNNLNQKVKNIELSVSSYDSDYTITIHYQPPGSADYFAASYNLIASDGITSRYTLNEDDTAEHLYVDIKGTLTQTATISLKSRTPHLELRLTACIFGALVFILLMVLYHLRQFFIDLYQNRDIFKILIVNDIKSKYAGSFLGIIWSFIQPIFTILVFWFVFQLGFKSPPVEDIPYILWFIPAYIPWLYFQDVMVNATGCLKEYSYLVKKMKFKVSVLPIIKVVSSFIIHLFFIAFLLFAYAIYGYKPSLMYIQLFYYSFAMIFLVCGLSWLIAALAVFMKDLSQIISIILQLGYFAIPVFWTEDMMEPLVITVLKLNPVYYIVQGYRDCMHGNTFFWHYPWQTIYFWTISISVFWIGITLFEKSRKHFADLL